MIRIFNAYIGSYNIDIQGKNNVTNAIVAAMLFAASIVASAFLFQESTRSGVLGLTGGMFLAAYWLPLNKMVRDYFQAHHSAFMILPIYTIATLAAVVFGEFLMIRGDILSIIAGIVMIGYNPIGRMLLGFFVITKIAHEKTQAEVMSKPNYPFKKDPYIGRGPITSI